MNIEAIAHTAIEEVRKKLAENYNYTIDTEKDKEEKTILYKFIFEDWWLDYIRDNIEKIENGEQIQGIRLYHTGYEYTLRFMTDIILYKAFELQGHEQLAYQFKNINPSASKIINDLRVLSDYPLCNMMFLETDAFTKAFAIMAFKRGYGQNLDGKDGIIYKTLHNPHEIFKTLDFNFDNCTSVYDCSYEMAITLADAIEKLKKEA